MDYLTDLEQEQMHVVIINVKSDIQLRIINIYRSFRPPGGISTDTFFVNQLSLIKQALCPNCYIVSDFNLDVGMAHRPLFLSIKLESFKTIRNGNNYTERA